MKKTLAVIAIFAAMLSAPYVIAVATADHTHDGLENVGHSGGTDAYGCHHDRKRGGYHCH